MCYSTLKTDEAFHKSWSRCPWRRQSPPQPPSVCNLSGWWMNGVGGHDLRPWACFRATNRLIFRSHFAATSFSSSLPSFFMIRLN